MPIPDVYLPATWRGTTRMDMDGSVGLSFNATDGSIVRLKLDNESARSIIETLAEVLAVDHGRAQVN